MSITFQIQIEGTSNRQKVDTLQNGKVHKENSGFQEKFIHVEHQSLGHKVEIDSEKCIAVEYRNRQLSRPFEYQNILRDIYINRSVS